MFGSWRMTAVKLFGGALGFAMSVQAAPGVALTLDVTHAIDDRGQVCLLQAHTTPHVTLLNLDGDRQVIEPEVIRFLHDLNPYFKEMIHFALLEAKVHHANLVTFKNAVFVPDLFKRGGFPGLKAYTPGPVANSVLINLNLLVSAFLNGEYRPEAAPTPGTQSVGGYNLQISPTTAVGQYTPHISVKNPSCYPGTGLPVQALTAYLQQTLTCRWHR